MKPRNGSANSLMGFSVQQPVIGAALQFFPALGTKQLDDLIDAYISGDAPIQAKRAAVTMEFCNHALRTGEMFKFFMVYPTLASARASPNMDSGYYSGYTPSPVLSDSNVASPSSFTKTAPANDFSHLPGMKIMTKDGRDVTNSASRGGKTEEDREHAHMMRKIKACESCRRKKTRCDPSHKRPTGGASSGRVTKRTTSVRPAAAPPQIACKPGSAIDVSRKEPVSVEPPTLGSSLLESVHASVDPQLMDWEQYIMYPDESTADPEIPYDYDFFRDPARLFSPTINESFSSSSTTPSQMPITPIDRDLHLVDGSTNGHDHKPILPYLNPGGVESGSNYMDFNLYSPASSFLDDDIGSAKELAASPIQTQRDHHQDFLLDVEGSHLISAIQAPTSTDQASATVSSSDLVQSIAELSALQSPGARSLLSRGASRHLSRREDAEPVVVISSGNRPLLIWEQDSLEESTPELSNTPEGPYAPRGTLHPLTAVNGGLGLHDERAKQQEEASASFASTDMANPSYTDRQVTEHRSSYRDLHNTMVEANVQDSLTHGRTPGMIIPNAMRRVPGSTSSTPPLPLAVPLAVANRLSPTQRVTVQTNTNNKPSGQEQNNAIMQTTSNVNNESTSITSTSPLLESTGITSTSSLLESTSITSTSSLDRQRHLAQQPQLHQKRVPVGYSDTKKKNGEDHTIITTNMLTGQMDQLRCYVTMMFYIAAMGAAVVPLSSSLMSVFIVTGTLCLAAASWRFCQSISVHDHPTNPSPYAQLQRMVHCNYCGLVKKLGPSSQKILQQPQQNHILGHFGVSR
ncbi:hypothetical protein GGS20DRAFT_495739 [Poronia punctata]|nr:hypothetical protein GGS20DRAFT_495739 [Poronia punctata]